MLNRREFVALGAAPAILKAAGSAKPLLDPRDFRRYVEFFNSMVPEEPVTTIPNAEAWEWMRYNIPFFSCPDEATQQIYYYRWWTYRKAIKATPAGYIITEFLKPVSHAGEYNALSCALGHHIAEGRWLRERSYIDQDVHYWLRGGADGGLAKNLHQFTGWVAWGVSDLLAVHGDRPAATAYLDALEADYAQWQQERLTPGGLFWQRDVSDGMEESASGGRKMKNIRPSINSCMYGNAVAIAQIARLAGKADIENRYRAKAETLRRLVQEKLWNPGTRFFETLDEQGRFVPVREAIGYTPWYFELPEKGKGYEEAWKQLMDPQGFYAPYGPATTERRSPLYKLDYVGDDCKWNGPAWPFATTIALRGLANVLNDYPQNAISRAAYLRTLAIYTHSHRLKLDDGRVIPWIDENQNPETGEWIARTMKIRKGTFYGRGDHYNHSAYCDLIVTGLVGLRPAAGDTFEVNPLADPAWDWFCLDRVAYHGRSLSIIWDRNGQKFGGGAGLTVYVDGEQTARRETIGRLTVPLT
ncbi:MAG TPA: glycosyl hydrolase family 65 protein [Bryobacteraceae bacterium]|nr:glycosyl hydrolase family 65 protein [Bryobacteraceae bacterium]